MQNTAPTKALTRRANRWKTLAFVVGSLGFFIAALGVLLFAIPLAPPTSPNYGLYLLARTSVLALGILTVLVAIGMMIRAFTFRTDNDLAQLTARYLATRLDASYTLVRNVSHREIGYIDAVLVGPPGALVFRLLDDRGVFVNDGANWVRRNKRGEWVPAGIDATREAMADIHKLRAFLAKRNLGDVPVFGVIVFTHEPPAAHITLKDSLIPVANLSGLYAAIQNNYLAMGRISPQQSAAVVRLLEQN